MAIGKKVFLSGLSWFVVALMILVMVDGPTWEVVTGKGLAILMLSAVLGALATHYSRYQRLAEEEDGRHEDYKKFVRRFVPDAAIARFVEEYLAGHAKLWQEAIRERTILENEGLKGLGRIGTNYEDVKEDLDAQESYHIREFRFLYDMAVKQEGTHRLTLKSADPLLYLPSGKIVTEPLSQEDLKEEVGTTSID